ncbi:MAG: prolipoprotein diacylglyceryl transferase [Bacilli bacterium]|nr:prolipoprotein diacylglyceryl transferase [Bacilli bacterium]
MSRIAFTILNINIYWYSICILIGVVIAYFLILHESKKHNINNNLITDLIFYTLIIGIIGARLYYIIFNLDYYLNNPSEILKIYNGGLAIHGGVISGIIFVYYYTKKYSINFLRILDIVSPAVIIAQSIGRWGNFFNKEAYGSITSLKILQNLHIPKFIINGMKINNHYYYPTFFFESILCLIGFIIIMLIRKNKNTKLGFQIGFYFIWYGIVRFFIEILREDSLMLFNIKMAQIISIISIILGIILLIRSKKEEKYYKE